MLDESRAATWFPYVIVDVPSGLREVAGTAAKVVTDDDFGMSDVDESKVETTSVWLLGVDKLLAAERVRACSCVADLTSS